MLGFLGTIVVTILILLLVTAPIGFTIDKLKKNTAPEDMSKPNYNHFAALTFLVMAIWSVADIFRKFGIAGISSLTLEVLLSIFELAVFCVLVMTFIKGKRDNSAALGFTLLAVYALLKFLIGFQLNLFHLFSQLILFAPYWAIAVMANAIFAGKFANYQGKIKKYWFVPAALCVLSMVFALPVMLLTGGFWYAASPFWGLSGLLDYYYLFLGLFFAALWMIYPDGLPEREVQKEEYCGIIKLIVLSALTLGIYYFIWIYRTTKNLNDRTDIAVYPENEHGVRTVLMCIFVPFYFIYWISMRDERPMRTAMMCMLVPFYFHYRFYKTEDCLVRTVFGCIGVPFYLFYWLVKNERYHRPGHELVAHLTFPVVYHIYWLYRNAQQVDRIAHKTGIQSNIAILCVAFAPLLPIVSAFILQDRINTIVQIENGEIAAPAAPMVTAASVAAVTCAPAVAAANNPDELPEL